MATPFAVATSAASLFLNPQPSEHAAGQGRASSAPGDGGIYDLHVSNAASRLDRLIEYSNIAPKRILVIAGDSFPAQAAEQRGLSVVTLAPAEVDSAGLAFLPTAAFDAAVFYCALERLSDPQAVLLELKRVLVVDGAVMVIAATVDSRVARLFKSGWWEFNARNLFYFSADTLQSLLIKSGYGDPVIDIDDRAVSLQYFRHKLSLIQSAWTRTALRLLVSIAPAFLRHRVFRALNSRRMVLVRAKTLRDVPRLSVIVPAFNEKATLATLMERVLAKSIDGVDIEVVLVESNSTDGTREEVLTYQDHPRVQVILEDRPRGKGHAVRTGLAACTGDFVLFQDADLEYDVHDYTALVAQLLYYRRNFVIGSRHLARSSVWKIRRFNDAPGLAVVFNLGHVFFLGLFNLLYRQSLTDPFSMFKVFRRDCLYGLTFECNRFDFDFEIVIKLLRKGYQPLELPVNYSARSPAEGKKVTMLRDPLTWLRALLRFRWGDIYSRGLAERSAAIAGPLADQYKLQSREEG